ncbi:hypothetical protein COO60DRAFT_1219251 [Scenedesmus sp. NREL 46B-D3]|nr:hypothetical protein COO60DRAFT_1219251 [Scenedesmus sp. NREL 46B-D3]
MQHRQQLLAGRQRGVRKDWPGLRLTASPCCPAAPAGLQGAGCCGQPAVAAHPQAADGASSQAGEPAPGPSSGTTAAAGSCDSLLWCISARPQYAAALSLPEASVLLLPTWLRRCTPVLDACFPTVPASCSCAAAARCACAVQVRAFKEDPLIFHGDLRVATGNELLRAMKHLAKHRSRISLPLYAVHGTKDAVTSLDAIEEFTGGVSSKEMQLVKVEGGYHEMLMGDERVASADGIVAWMRQRVEQPWQQEQQEDVQQQQEGARGAGPEHVSKL